MELGAKYGISVIPGVEISTESESGENIHVLGYFALNMSAEDNAILQDELSKIREARYTRGKGMLEKLEGVACVSWKEKQTNKKKKGEALFISFHFQNENKKGGRL